MSIPSPNKGKYSKIDSVKVAVGMEIASQHAGKFITLYLGKSRESGEWEVFAAMVRERGRWKMIPVGSDLTGG